MSSMYRENQQSVEVSDTKYDESDGSLLINNLIYEMPKSLSLAVNRTNSLQYPQRSTYAVSRNTTVVFDWNTGNAFIDPANSFLKFKMVASGVAAVAPPTFGSGSALNLLHEIRIRSRSGTELDRVENFNLYKKFVNDYTRTQQWKNTVGASFFLDSATPIFNNGNTLRTEVCIPLTEVATFFCPIKKQLIPPQSASGLRIELSLESIAKTFVDAAAYFANGSSLTLEDIHMSLDTVNMSDETSKLLNLESSQSGLEYTYPRVYNYSNTYDAGTSNFTLQVSKAVSQAEHAMAIIQNDVSINSATVDSFLAESFRTRSYQWRLGAQYYPHIPVQSDVSAGVTIKGMEPYLLALASFDKMKMPFSETSMTPADFSNDSGVISTSLSRNMSLAVAGLPVNNSRLLELIVERDGASDAGAKRTVSCYLQYLSVARAYIDNIAVAI